MLESLNVLQKNAFCKKSSSNGSPVVNHFKTFRNMNSLLAI